MSDKTFQWSVTGLAVLVVLWIVLGIVSGVMGWESSGIMGLVGWVLGLTILVSLFIVMFTVFPMFFRVGWKSVGLCLLLVLLWSILGGIFGITGWGWVVPSGLLIEIFGGVLLLHYWGKSYMAQE